MRDYRLQALINYIKIIPQLGLDLDQHLRYGFQWLRPYGKASNSSTKMFDLNDLSYLRRVPLAIGKNDPKYFARLFEPQTLGIRSWEYGVLFSNLDFRGKKVLDLGVGSSRLAKYLVKLGAEVTAIDIDTPLEHLQEIRSKKYRFLIGDMTNLKFADSSFDIVLCISALEHLDMKGNGYHSDETYTKRAMKAIGEMTRVVKKNGFVYITTDFYLKRQKTDKWPYSLNNKIRGAFRWSLSRQFLKQMKSMGLFPLTKPEIDKKLLIADKNRANYRGRYFTTIAYLLKKI